MLPHSSSNTFKCLGFAFSLIFRISSSWSIIFEDYFIFPYLKGIVKKDFDIDITQPTHLKMIIKNNKTH